MAIRKLLHYFTDHKVMVVTSFPLGDIVRNRDAAGRISKGALELMGTRANGPRHQVYPLHRY